MNGETDAVKEWLLRYSELNRNIDNLIQRSELLRDKAYAPSSTQIDGMPHVKGGNTDKIGTLVAKCDELDAEAREKIAESRSLYKEIDNMIKKIQGKGSADRRAVLQMRYLDLAGWSDVVFMLFGNKPDFADKEDSYTRRTYKLHGEALTILKDFIPTFSDTENEDIKGL